MRNRYDLYNAGNDYPQFITFKKYKPEPEPEPLVPAQTIRFRFEEADYDPSSINNGGIWTKIDNSLFNDWDWYCAVTDWTAKFNGRLTGAHKVSIVATGDISNINSGSHLFYKCTGLTSIPDNSFNNVANADSMFYNCTGLTSIGNNSFNNVTDASYMFVGCTGLTSIGNNSFNSVTIAYRMFYGCSGLTSIPDNMFNNVANADSMFYNCTGLTTIPDNSFNNVTNASYMFIGCAELTSIPDNSFNNVTNAYYMFISCTNVEHGALALYNKWVAGGKVTNHSNTFIDCGKDTTTGLAELQQIPTSWGGLAAG